MKGNSERIPGTNKREFCGSPLFHWILDALNESDCVDEIIINTDSNEIAENAIKYYNVTIHMRPNNLLDIQSDEANQIMSYDLDQTDGEYFIQTHSTNPMVKGETINKAVKVFFDNIDKYDSLFSVTALQKRLYDSNGKALNHDPKNLIKTQDQPLIFEENSCFYLFSRKIFTKINNRIGNKPYFFKIDRYEAVDIDEEYDFLFAEKLMQNRLTKLSN